MTEKSKYDFKTNVSDHIAYDWACKYIKDNSQVLEIGPGNGAIGSFLAESKNCSIDIIEFDEQLGEKAKKFARHVLAGSIMGDIESMGWESELQQSSYDCIIICEVLEHLHNPQLVLDRLYQYLKPDGCLIAAVPNIGHNAVIIGLLNDRFDYSDLGLLDNTHIHLFTYKAIRAMLEKANFCIVLQKANLCGTEQTELNSYFNEVPDEIAAYLKKRLNGNAYQYVFLCDKNTRRQPLPFLEIPGIDISEYMPAIYIQETADTGFSEEKKITYAYNWSDEVSITFELSAYSSVKQLRFDPMSMPCVISDFKAVGNVSGRLVPIGNNATEYGKELYFHTEDPNLTFQLTDTNDQSIVFSYKLIAYEGKPEDGLEHCYQLLTLKQKLQDILAQKKSIENAKNMLQKEKNMLETEKNILLNSNSWKITAPIRRCSTKVKKLIKKQH